MPNWGDSQEPSQINIRQWLSSVKAKVMPMEQSRWLQSNIDTLFYAGAQEYVNRFFGMQGQGTASTKFYFNLLQQPVNMITGYERQHRKGFSYVPTEGADPKTTDQYTKLMTHVCNKNGIHEQKSKAKEQACITGFVLMQPYLDYTGDDQAQGQLKTKVWEYNSFLVDPYFRSGDMSDATFVWCQEYISKKEAEFRFPDKVQNIAPMTGSPQRFGEFYFLPENYNMNRNDLMVLSYVWYKWKRKKKRLYSHSRKQFFDFAEEDESVMKLLQAVPDMELVEVEVPTWKLATVLNDQLIFQGDNPLGFDDCPFIPYYWNYEPHINYYDLRCRGLVRTMRDSNYLLNRRIIINHDISEATINAGWIRKVGAVANEDNLKKSGQGWDVIINEGYDMTDCQKIIPSAVPESDMALADQLRSLIFGTSGVDLENWSAQNDKQASSLTTMLKQAANLMVLQKYFDQWDYSDKLLGERLLQVCLHNWNAEKVQLFIGEEPTELFFSKIFAKFQCLVEESDLTPTQQNLQAQQMLDINVQFAREVFPPSMIIPKLNITGKAEIIEFLKNQEEQASAVQSEATNIQHAFEEAKLKELYSKAVSNLATARERQGRLESNIGLYEERLSEITRNRALATKDKMAAIAQLVETIEKFGSLEASMASGFVDKDQEKDVEKEDREKVDAHIESGSTQFLEQIMGGLMQQSSQQNPGQNMEQMV